uniref:Nicotinate phosphoribosyltransferase n=1 Tax=Petromyzon marinus TaxID=7757 RepID=A0AAJ7XF97_PETMA|nr:nicotinate phosphoribosyltransferase [Petromyzon marinus]
MAYALWRAGRACARACFEASFRRAPFGGGGALSAGLADCVAFVQGFRIDAEDIDFLRAHLPDYVSDEFYAFLSGLDASDVVLHALQEGTVAFPQVPLLRVDGPLCLLQLLETPLLNFINYASLVATNAARFRLAAGSRVELMELGLRRAQGPNGALSASRYAYLGGFDATSNVLAAQVHGVPLAGTQAHSYITAFSGLHDLTTRELAVPDGGPTVDLVALSLEWRPRVCSLLGRAERDARDGELAAFVSYAQAFPRRLLLLVDTYSVHGSGTVNFCAVALALATLGLRAVGVRLDSGDLARQSLEVRAAFRCCAQSFELPWFSELKIVASNDVNEEKILAYNKQGHAIDCFGVGTALVTCERQPSLGCIYKLVELDGVPRCKLTEDEEKTTLPGRKAPYRLYGDDGRAVLDVLLGVEELAPRAGQLLPCRLLRPLGEQSLVRPSRVAPLHTTFWDRGRVCSPLLPLKELRAMSAASLGELGAEHKDLEAPTPYPVAVSEKIWALLEEMRRT